MKVVPGVEPYRDDPYNVEVIDGVRMMSPRPAQPHIYVASRLHIEIGHRFDRPLGPSGPDEPAWRILHEPELNLQGNDPIIPDIAGWRRERLPEITDAATFTVAPDWLCEVLSPSTEAWDRASKIPVYAEHGVAHVWLVDPLLRTLEILQLDGATYRLLRTVSGDKQLRPEPFAAMELDLTLIWPPRRSAASP